MVSCFPARCCSFQAGSQYRSKADPAGQVQGDKWIAGKLEGRTTLLGEAAGPRCRDLAAAKKEFEDAQAAAAAEAAAKK